MGFPVALPRLKAKRRKRKPFGPHERWALMILCMAGFFVPAEGYLILWQLEHPSPVTLICACIDFVVGMYWYKLGRRAWKIIKAWLDSECDD